MLALDGEVRDGITLRSLVLPVVWPRAAKVLERALEGSTPAAVLSFGIHGKRDGAFRVETLAANALDFRIPDNDGNAHRGKPVSKGASPALDISLPAAALLAALRERGLSARFSRNAGRFLCNAVYFHVLSLGFPAAFIHVPPVEPGESSKAVVAAVDACARVAARLEAHSKKTVR